MVYVNSKLPFQLRILLLFWVLCKSRHDIEPEFRSSIFWDGNLTSWEAPGISSFVSFTAPSDPQMRPCCNKFSLRRKDWLASFSCYSSVSSTIYEMGVWRREIYYLKPFMCWLYPEVDLELQRLMPFSNWSNTRNMSQKLVIPLANTKQRLGFRPWWDLLICFFSEFFYNSVQTQIMLEKKGLFQLCRVYQVIMF